MKTKFTFTKRPILLLLLLLPAVTFAQNITRLEYFIDNDPGFGNGISIPLSPAPDITNINLNVNISSLAVGFHYLYIRAKDANGIWGLTSTLGFHKEKTVFSLPVWADAEYFIDTDPGIGNATHVALQPGIGYDSLISSIPVNQLSQGFHYLYFRSRDSFGSWGLTNIRPFFFDKALNKKYPLVNAEYFLDADPGFGNGTPMSLVPDTVLPNLTDSFSTQNLTAGFHNVYTRAMDSVGKWGLTNVRSFYVEKDADTLLPIVAVEYFIDNDPGFGNGTSIPVVPDTVLPNLIDSANTSFLTVGFHQLYVRAKNAYGRWSLTNTLAFYKQAVTAALPDIVYIESFFGSDPGFGNATGFSVPPSSDITSLSFYVDETCLPDGDTTLLYVRAMDNNGIWGHTNIDTLIKKPLAINTADSLIVCYADSVKLTTSTAIGISYTWLLNGTALTGQHDSVLYAKNTGNYQVIIGNQQPCADTSLPVYVAVKPIVPAPVAATPITYCQFDYATALTASGSGLLWYSAPFGGNGTPNAPIPITTVSGTHYYYVSQTLNGCESNRDTVEVITNPKPSLPVITLSNDTLYSSASSGNQWYDTSGILVGQTLSYLVPQSSGEYYVVVTLNGCTSDTSIHFHFTISGFVQLPNDMADLSIYPNPAHSILNIRLTAISKTLTYMIFDTRGRLLLTGNILQEISIIPLTGLSEGIYILSVDGHYNCRFCVMKNR